MPNPRSILSGLARAVEPMQESKAVGNAALEQAKRLLDQKRLGVWDGKEPYDVWKARREAELQEPQKFAVGGQAFPLQDDFQAEIERRAARPRTRAGVPVEDTNVLGGALQGLGETLLGAGRGALATTLGAPADILNLFNVKQMGTPDIPYGAEFFKETMPLAPTTQTGKAAQQMGEFLPLPVVEGYQAAKAGAKKLAPTAKEMLEAGLEKAMAPSRMYAVPPGEVKPGKVKAPANEVGFYNPAEKAALNLQRKKGTGDSFISDLKKQPGVTDERIAELGLDQFRGKPNVTREEVIAAAEQNRIPLRESVKRERDEAAIDELEREWDELSERKAEAQVTGDFREASRIEGEMLHNLSRQKTLKSVEEAKFSPTDYPDYSMPGGTNYREIRVGLPTKRLSEEEARVVLGARPDVKLSEADITYASNKAADSFEHPAHHGNEPNVLLHLRVADHTDAEGKSGLLVDELQSDWHQQGSKSGYKSKEDAQAAQEFKDYSKQLADKYDLNPEQNLAMYASMKRMDPAEVSKYEQLQSAWVKSQKGVPDAPFKDNWYQLGLKRAIKEAADSGKDRLYLTTGERQADRYDLSKQVDQIVVPMVNADGTRSVRIDPSNGTSMNMMVDADGVVTGYTTNALQFTGKKLADVIGKEMSEKVMKANSETEFSGFDLKVGGEGMKQWYDKTYKNYLEKYAKQHGSKLGMTKISEGEPVYYIDITDAMRESAKKGQSYKDGGSVHPSVEKFASSLPHPAVTSFMAKFADGGGVWNTKVDGRFNTIPDVSDAEGIIQGPAV